jgi:IclR family acetate operon transcriptional repressor
MQQQQRRRVVPAVDRAARMLALIEAAGRPMSITELAGALDASKGTVREILETLREHGLLDRDESTKLYRLGPQLLRLGASSGESLDLLAAARPCLERLSASLREIAVFLTPHEDRLLIQAAAEPPDPRTPILVSATPGRTVPANAGACGKVLLVWGDESTRTAVRRTLRKSGLPVDRIAAEVARAGYATDDEEFMAGIRGVSAPVIAASGRLVGLLLVSGLAGSLTLEQLDGAGEATREAAASISRAIGGRGVTAPA